MVKEINGSRADVVWVGIGVPKQEKWMAELREELDAPVLVGVGAAFDFHAGLVPQAPNWIQDAGLEWAYRLAHEPRRLWRRYTRYNPRFVLGFARQLTRHRRRTPAASGAPMAELARAGHEGAVSTAPTASIVIPTRNRPDYLGVYARLGRPAGAAGRRRGARGRARRGPQDGRRR